MFLSEWSQDFQGLSSFLHHLSFSAGEFRAHGHLDFAINKLWFVLSSNQDSRQWINSDLKSYLARKAQTYFTGLNVMANSGLSQKWRSQSSCPHAEEWKVDLHSSGPLRAKLHIWVFKELGLGSKCHYRGKKSFCIPTQQLSCPENGGGIFPFLLLHMEKILHTWNRKTEK